jgi:hypothetical protein
MRRDPYLEALRSQRRELGPRCQTILRPFLDRPTEAYLFSPQESRAEYQAQRAMRRKTKRTPSDLKRKRKANPQRAPKDHYTVNTMDSFR